LWGGCVGFFWGGGPRSKVEVEEGKKGRIAALAFFFFLLSYAISFSTPNSTPSTVFLPPHFPPTLAAHPNLIRGTEDTTAKRRIREKNQERNQFKKDKIKLRPPTDAATFFLFLPLPTSLSSLFCIVTSHLVPDGEGIDTNGSAAAVDSRDDAATDLLEQQKEEREKKRDEV